MKGEKDMLNSIYDNVIKGDLESVKEGVTQALAAGHSPSDILNSAMISAMHVSFNNRDGKDC